MESGVGNTLQYYKNAYEKPTAARRPTAARIVRTARRRSARGFRFGRGLSRLRKCGNLDKILKKSRVRVLREKLFRFFSGRNGPDALGQATSFVCVALILLNLFVGSYVLYALELLLMAVWIFRLFSRNTARRRAENARYLKLRDRVRGAFRRLKLRFSERKTHVYKTCPHCRATLRLPRAKGEHTTRCPRCGKEFGVKIR